MPNICKALMRNSLSLRVGKKGNTCYFAFGTWLSNFCQEFSIPLELKNVVSTKVLRTREEEEKEMAARCKYNVLVLFFVMASQAS